MHHAKVSALCCSVCTVRGVATPLRNEAQRPAMVSWPAAGSRSAEGAAPGGSLLCAGAAYASLLMTARFSKTASQCLGACVALVESPAPYGSCLDSRQTSSVRK